MTLHLLADAHLFGSRDPEDYMAFLSDQLEPVEPIEENRLTWFPPSMRDQDFDYTFIKKALSRWNNALIRLIDAHDVAIIGEEARSSTAAIPTTRRARRTTAARTA